MAASLWTAALVFTAFKSLFIPAYKSTDFEVHRNWLAITHSLPVHEWYRDATSQWTLDYPPLFAWFEYALSHVAVYFDPQMLVLTNLNYSSDATVLFQRLSVIVTDLVYVYAAITFSTKFTTSSHNSPGADNWSWMQSPRHVLGCLLLGNIGLTIVDHIHFQYNGFMFGVLLLSITRIFEDRHISAAFWFTVLINMKHIYVYMAPAYFVYLLRCYVFTSKPDGSISLWSFSPFRLISLGLTVLSVFFSSFLPFLKKDDLLQVLQRLFPFKRGLCHAYWAPNFWALYNVADKALLFASEKLELQEQLGISKNMTVNATMTGGLVQTFDHIVLPTITPSITMAVTLIAIAPSLLHLWLYPNKPQNFLLCLITCTFTSYMFGWHVHEKAILMVIIPLTLLVLQNKRLANIFLMLTAIGHYSLFPLLFTKFEIPLKILLWLLYSAYAFPSLSYCYKWVNPSRLPSLPLLCPIESLYLTGLFPLEVYKLFVHDRMWYAQQFPFLPLLMTSVYCAVGVLYCWVNLYWFTVWYNTKYNNNNKARKTR